MSPIQAITQVTIFIVVGSWAVAGLILGTFVGISSSKLELNKYNSPLSFHPQLLFLLTFLYWPVILPWYIDIRSSRKKGDLVLKSDHKDSITHFWIRVVCFLVACLLPWIWYFGFYVFVVGPVVPYLNDPLSRFFLLIALFVWQPVGLLYALHSKTFSSWLATCLVTAGPPIFLFMISMPVFNLRSIAGVASTQELMDLTKMIADNIPFFGITWAFVVPVELVLCVLSFPGMWIALSRKLAKKGSSAAVPETASE